ncbi:MAG: hypothetical protein GX580_13105 [Candidatus Hydrogenedens sp.]|nr:hypothetical protein [Candidatus Hydrogenedens sp.]
MKISIDAERLRRVLDAMVSSGDAEKLATEYACDFFDAQPPLSMEIELAKGGCEVLSAYELAFSPELNGWYSGERVEDAALIERILREAADIQE